MDYTLFLKKEKEYYSQDFSVMTEFMNRVRNSLITGQELKTKDLSLAGIWDFNPKISFAYLTIFQAGEKMLRYGCRRNTIDLTLNRDIQKIRENKRFGNFELQNTEKCRILLEFVIDKKYTDLNHCKVKNLMKIGLK